MKIIYTHSFEVDLLEILMFISKDSQNKAKTFRLLLEVEISSLVFMPYKTRKSHYFNSEEVRDLVFKGYVIVYKIDKEQNLIYILNIIKYRLK